MSGAGEMLQDAVLAALRTIRELGVYDGPPVQAVVPNAVVEVGPETDWSHKSGLGRELRVAVTLRDDGERPARLRRLIGEAEAVLETIPAQLPGWQLVTLRFLRSRLLRESGKAPHWAAVIEYRARMLAV